MPLSPLATEQVESALRALDVLLKANRFYPPAHPAFKTAIVQSLEKCAPLLANGEPLLLTIHKEGFSLDDSPLNLRYPALKNFATQLFARHVRSLVLLPDLNARDLHAFARALSQEPQDIQRQGGAQALLEAACVTTLWVNEIDLSRIYEQKGELAQRLLELEANPPEGDDNAEHVGTGAQEANAQEQTTLENLLREMEQTESDQHFQILSKQLDPLIQLNLNDAGRPQVLRALLFLCRCSADRQRSLLRRQDCQKNLALVCRDEILNFLVQSLGHKKLPDSARERLFSLLSCFQGKIERNLLQHLSKERDAQNRKIFGAALVHLGSSSIPFLLEALKDSRWFVVRNVISILGEIREQETAEALVPLLAHVDLRVRRETIRALTKIGGRSAEGTLLQILSSEETEMRRQAILSLGAMKCVAAVPQLLALATLKDRKGRRLEEKKEAISALGQIGDDTAVDQLNLILNRRRFWFAGKDDELRTAAALALGNIGSSAALSSLQKASGDRSESVARTARQALQRIEKASPHAS